MTKSIILMICILVTFQMYRMSSMSMVREQHFTIHEFSNKPCKKLDSYKLNIRHSMGMLISNCWPILKHKESFFSEVLFPMDFKGRLRNYRRMYELSVLGDTNKQLEFADRMVIASVLKGDSNRRIEGYHLLCRYPTLITQLNLSQKSDRDIFEIELLQHCQNIEKGEYKKYFQLEKNTTHSKFLDELQ